MEKPIVRYVRVSSHYKKVRGKRKRIRGYLKKIYYKQVIDLKTGYPYLVRIPDPCEKKPA